MIKVEKIEVWGFRHAIRGMRNPLQSWHKSDSVYLSHQYCDYDKEVEMMQYCDIVPVIGKNDLDLMHRLYVAGTEHRKYLRQIFVSMDITTNHTIWAEFDTYKVGVTRNSCSKMHTIHVKEFAPEDFSHEGIDEVGGVAVVSVDATRDAVVEEAPVESDVVGGGGFPLQFLVVVVGTVERTVVAGDERVEAVGSRALGVGGNPNVVADAVLLSGLTPAQAELGLAEIIYVLHQRFFLDFPCEGS